MNEKKIYITELGLECEMAHTPLNKSESEIESRIRESEDSCQVKAHSKPWVVRLIVANALMCGGTLIGTTTVVTAAHCVCTGNIFKGNLKCTNQLDQWEETRLIMGDHDRTKTDCQDQQCFRVRLAQPHKDWNGNVYFPFVLNHILRNSKDAISLNHVFFQKKVIFDSEMILLCLLLIGKLS